MKDENKIIVDIDGTICPIKKPDEKYEDLIPYENVIAKLKEYKARGFEIVLFTARNMRTHGNSLGRINKHTAPVLINWLEKYEIPYDEVYFGKPWPGPDGFYLDDRTIRPKELLNNSEDGIKEIFAEGRDVNKKVRNIVITMAGESSRFTKAGFKIPKFMIKVKGISLFQYSLMSLVKFFSSDTRVIFITQKKFDSTEFIKSNASMFGLKDIRIIELEETTDGQATTALQAEKEWEEDGSLLIYNIDTFVEPSIMDPSMVYGKGWVPCTHEDGDHWSFVKINHEGFATEVREKKRISENCSIGLYWFDTCGLFKQCYDEFFKVNKAEAGEKYIAPMYNWLIEKDMPVGMTVIPKESIYPLGTPDELNRFKAEGN